MTEKFIQFLLKNLITGLTLFFCLGVLFLLINIQNFEEKLIKTQAINNVKNTAQVFKKASNIKSIFLVKKIQFFNNLEVANNEANQLLLTVNFLKELANEISQENEGMEVKLYSNYPFPWHEEEQDLRTEHPKQQFYVIASDSEAISKPIISFLCVSPKEEQAIDDFEQEAIEFLQENPDKSFYRFEQLENDLIIRYAEANIIQIPALECYNNELKTPKTECKIEEVVEVLAITKSLKNIRMQVQENIKQTLVILVSLSVIGITGLGLSKRRLDEYSQKLKNQVEVRQETIEQAFTEIHNGPLQDLALLLREIQQPDNPGKSLFPRLKALDNEIRAVGDHLIEKSKLDDLNESLSLTKMRLGEGSILDLNNPLDELLYQVFTLTLKRDLPYFQTLKIKIVDFTILSETSFDLEIKRELCYYLEEALLNVGKHAQGVTRITVIGENSAGFYSLKVQDNGGGLVADIANKGTKNALKLAKKLKGNFIRENLAEGGVVCCLSWKSDV